MMQGGGSGIASYIRKLIRTMQRVDSLNQYDILMPLREADLIELNAPNVRKSLTPGLIANPIVNFAYRVVIHNGLYKGLKEGARG